jgi:glycerol-3-phosphate dehydrogenase
LQDFAMIRDLRTLSCDQFDLAVIGGGIYGACAAWDAAVRGLKVALLEQGDFGAATSANSLKTLHGGLRYLQNLDLLRMRQSIRERSRIMRIAPHLVRLLPCVMPTSGHLMRGRELMSVALLLNDIISHDRNHLIDPSNRIPRGRLLSKAELLQKIPFLKEMGRYNGGALWYDAQMLNSERVTLSFVQSAH